MYGNKFSDRHTWAVGTGMGVFLVIGVMVSVVTLLFLGASGSKMNFVRRLSMRKSRKPSKRKAKRKADTETGDGWSRFQNSDEQRQLGTRPEPDGSPRVYEDVNGEYRANEVLPKSPGWPKLQEPIAVCHFLTRYQQMASSDPSEFKKEFQRLPKPDESRFRIGSTDENKKRNRFKNIKPYDETRVKLYSSTTSSDYINANYIQGLFKGDVHEKMFIATQGPLNHTIADFWQMVWEQNCSFIVMLTNPIENKKVKCAEYWPEKDCNKDVQVMKLCNVKEEVEPFFVRRTIEMVKDRVSRTVVQYQFTSWDDKEILETAMPIWEVLDEIGQHLHKSGFRGPLLVNCSAGIGRTGTFIALAILRGILHHKEIVDVFNVVYDMRTRRMTMVQVEDQYKFIYESLVIWYLLKRTSFQVRAFRRDMKNWWTDVKTSQRNRASNEFRLLEFICPPKRHGVQQAGELEENIRKNRFPRLIPDDEHRPLLMTSPPYDPRGNNYINASFHHSFQKKYAFIATQTPLNDTIGAFWSMVLDYKVACIVKFNEGTQQDTVYWPEKDFEIDYGPFCVACTSMKRLTENITMRYFTLTSRHQEARSLRQFCINGQQRDDDLAESITTAVKHVQEYQRATGNPPIAVHCTNGIGLSGCFMAIYSAIDRLNAQHVVDVFTTVRRIRQTRPKVVDTKERYMMVYEALNVYLIHTEQSYSNFQDF